MLCTRAVHRCAPAQCVACLAVVSTHPWPRLPRVARYAWLCAPVRSAEQQATSRSSTLALRHACPSPPGPRLPSSFARRLFFLRRLNSFLHVYLTDSRVPPIRPIPHLHPVCVRPTLGHRHPRISPLPVLRSLASPTRVVLLLLNHLCARRTSPHCCPRSTHKQKSCDNPPRKIPYYHLRPIHFGR
jgi:hypothetical protein